MCSLEEAFPTINFENEKFINNYSPNPSGYAEFNQMNTINRTINNENVPHLITNTMPGEIEKKGPETPITSPTMIPPYTNKEARQGLLSKQEKFNDNNNNNDAALTSLENRLKSLEDTVKTVKNNVINLEIKYKNRNIHDLILFIVILTFIVLIVDSLLIKKK